MKKLDIQLLSTLVLVGFFVGCSVSNVDISDLLVHDMGPGLADGVTQGQAGTTEFRTAPLWGLGQRLFFLHDGRTSDLLEAIRAHKSGASLPVTPLRRMQ